MPTDSPAPEAPIASAREMLEACITVAVRLASRPTLHLEGRHGEEQRLGAAQVEDELRALAARIAEPRADAADLRERIGRFEHYARTQDVQTCLSFTRALLRDCLAALSAPAPAVERRQPPDCEHVIETEMLYRRCAYCGRNIERVPVAALSLTSPAVDVEAKEVIRALLDALIWCSGSGDFAPEGKARVGWRLGPQTAIERASAFLSPTTSKEPK